MTQPTLLESGLAPPVPVQNTVNTYAQSMVSLLTRGNPERAPLPQNPVWRCVQRRPSVRSRPCGGSLT